MNRRAEDEEREERINMEIVVDANGPEEQAMGWYYYLADTMNFPFSARCVARRTISPFFGTGRRSRGRGNSSSRGMRA